MWLPQKSKTDIQRKIDEICFIIEDAMNDYATYEAKTRREAVAAHADVVLLSAALNHLNELIEDIE